MNKSYFSLAKSHLHYYLKETILKNWTAQALQFQRKASNRVYLKDAPLSGQLPISERKWSLITGSLSVIGLFIIFFSNLQPVSRLISPVISPILDPVQRLESIPASKKGHEVFGFHPWWMIDKHENIDFSVLTTYAYFGVPVTGSGDLDTDDQGYRIFKSSKATDIFKRAHDHGTRVVLTVTQMDNETIKEIVYSDEAKQKAIDQIVAEVKDRGIDGVNVDFEYTGTPGSEARDGYTDFVTRLTDRMHAELPGSRVTISVYALSAKDKKLYDIASLGKVVDGVFVMAYDFAVTGSEAAMPTAPLYGHKEGRYYYDIASSIEDFTALMPAEKVILGVPYYGYNYLVSQPGVKVATRPASWRGRPTAQTYTYVNTNLPEEQTGWDDIGKVGWKAYYDADGGTWRQIFLEDVRSLGIKYDFAKSKNLGGVGMWALGMDNGRTELWDLLREKFGVKIAKASIY